jgi:hypothetical protein
MTDDIPDGDGTGGNIGEAREKTRVEASTTGNCYGKSGYHD